jgi:RNA polymerase sigma factor (sigma-70 family)
LSLSWLSANPNQAAVIGVEHSVDVHSGTAIGPAALTFSSRLRGTDDEASDFVEAASPHLASMLRLARRLGRQNAEDIVQDALLRAWSKRGQYDPARGPFRSWLLAITAERAYKTWRWTSRHKVPAVRIRTGVVVDERLDLERSLMRLSPKQRQAVDCFYFVGLTVAETSVVMGCPPGTVKSTLAAARSRLRHLLEEGNAKPER